MCAFCARLPLAPWRQLRRRKPAKGANELRHRSPASVWVRRSRSWLAANGQSASSECSDRLGSGQLEDDILRAFPERHLAECGEVLAPLCHGQEVVAGQLADLACKADAAIRQE